MKPDKTPKTTPAPNEARRRQLKQLFPECLTEGEVDLGKLADILYVCDGGGVNLIGITSIGTASAMPFACSTSLPRQPSCRAERNRFSSTAPQTSSLKAITWRC